VARLTKSNWKLTHSGEELETLAKEVMVQPRELIERLKELLVQ
jgi:hypothetical protein